MNATSITRPHKRRLPLLLASATVAFTLGLFAAPSQAHATPCEEAYGDMYAVFVDAVISGNYGLAIDAYESMTQIVAFCA